MERQTTVRNPLVALDQPPALQASPGHRHSPGMHPMPALPFSPGTVYIHSGLRYYQIPIGEICFVEAKKNFCKITTCRGPFMVMGTLKDIETVLAPPMFYRIHRSFIVGMAHVKSFDRRTVRIADQELPVGVTYRAAFLNARPLIGISRSGADTSL